MTSDFRLSLRSLLALRGFAVVAVLTLAVGIGSTTAIFSALRALVLSPYSYPRSDQIVHVWSGEGWPLSPAGCPPAGPRAWTRSTRCAPIERAQLRR